MKSSEEMVNSLFERRSQYMAEQKKSRKTTLKTAMSVLSFCLVVLMGFGVWQSGLLTSPQRPTEDTSQTGQVAGTDMKVYADVNDLFSDSELVIIGTVDSITEVSEEFHGETLYAAKSRITVKEVIKGDQSIGSVSVLQGGKPDSDDCEKKLKKDRRYVLFLNPKDFQGETVYDCTGVEQGIFEVDNNNRLYSYVDFGICATFDNKPLDAVRDVAAR